MKGFLEGIRPKSMFCLTTALLLTVNTHAKHPQDGLSPAEIKQVKSLLLKKGVANKKSLYPLFELIEPSKESVYQWQKNGKLPQRKVLVHFRKNDSFYSTKVNLNRNKVYNTTKLNKQPMILAKEFETAMQLVLENPDFIKALAKRNIKPSDVNCVPLTAGNFGAEREHNKRLVKVPCIGLPKEGANYWAKPVEGLYGVVDLEKNKVLEILDTGNVPVATDDWNYYEEGVAKRTKLRKTKDGAKLHEPNTSNVKIKDSTINWDIWKFHLRVDKRPGIVISDVKVNDGKKWRNLMYQMHLSEVFVPYMDPSQGWNYRTYMDSGEYGFGVFLSPLRKNIDCPNYAQYLPAIINDDLGNPLEIPDAICVFERNIGNPAWRHFAMFAQGPDKFVPGDGRPETELVVRSASEVGNYDYLVDYRFKQNGDIYIKVGASGLDAVKGVASTSTDSKSYQEDTKYGSLIAPNLVAANHDHYFNFRLDMDIDQPNNMAMKMKLVPFKDNSPHNRRGTMWKVAKEMIHSEQEGIMRFSAMKPQHFMMMNTNQKGPLGHHPAYMIHHGSVAYGPFDFDGDMAMKRNAYIESTLWNTRYDPEERYAGGKFAVGSDGSDTLAQWVKKDRYLANQDIVTWYTAGFHHVPRTEDWPVMSTEWKTIHLQPMNFFPHNPALTIRMPDDAKLPKK